MLETSTYGGQRLRSLATTPGEQRLRSLAPTPGVQRLRTAAAQGSQRLRTAAASVLAVMLVLALCPNVAFAYFDRGPVGISLGSGSVGVTAGQTVSVSVALSPAQDAQTLGCGMAECPQSCGEKGCLDANGQCICAGAAYTTYYTDVSASSSNGAVATASYAGGALTVYGVGEGTATITLTASLRQHSSTSASLTVTVSAPAGGNTGNTSNGGSPAGTGGNGNTAGNGGATSGGAGAGNQQMVPPQAGQPEATETQTDTSNTSTSSSAEKTVQSMMGTNIHIVRYSDATDVISNMRQIAGTEDEVTFWKGGTADHPDYSWSFLGEQLDEQTLAGFATLDLGITISAQGSDLTAPALKDAQKTLVLEFAHSGALPAPAIIYIAAPPGLNESDALTLYFFDPATSTFIKRLEGLRVEAGYIAFSIDHCSTWAISASDLSALSSARGDSGASADGFPLMPVVVGGVLVLIAILATVLVLVNRRKGAVARAGGQATLGTPILSSRVSVSQADGSPLGESPAEIIQTEISQSGGAQSGNSQADGL